MRSRRLLVVAVVTLTFAGASFAGDGLVITSPQTSQSSEPIVIQATQTVCARPTTGSVQEGISIEALVNDDFCFILTGDNGNISVTGPDGCASFVINCSSAITEGCSGTVTFKTLSGRPNTWNQIFVCSGPLDPTPCANGDPLNCDGITIAPSPSSSTWSTLLLAAGMICAALVFLMRRRAQA